MKRRGPPKSRPASPLAVSRSLEDVEHDLRLARLRFDRKAIVRLTDEAARLRIRKLDREAAE